MVNDVNGLNGESVVSNILVCDMTVIRGLSVNREENGLESEYKVFVDIDDMGLVIYTPIYL